MSGDETDGRTARRNRNRDAVLDTYFELLSSGVAEPTFEQIADQAGVSHRSVYRYFDSLDDLEAASTKRAMTWVGPLLERSLEVSSSSDPLVSRIDDLVRGRLDAYEQTSKILRVAYTHSGSSETFQRRIEIGRKFVRNSVAEVFAGDLASVTPASRDLRISAIAHTISFTSLDFYLDRTGHPRDDVHRLLAMQILSVVTAPSSTL